MNVKKAIFFGIILISFLLPFVALAHAQKVPNYVGIKEGTTYTWKTEYDDDPLATYYEDSGYTEDAAKLEAEGDFKIWEWSTKTVGRKVYIVDFYEESEEDMGSHKYERVKYVYNEYKTKDLADNDAWKKVEKYDTDKIYESSEHLYEGAVSLVWGDGLQLYFIPKNLHLDDIADMRQDDIDANNWDREYDADCSTIKTQYFLQKKVVGISTEWNWKDNSNTESFESISKYNDDGILYYYEWTYDGDVIEKLELDTIGGTYLIENWWWIAIIAVAAIIAVIIIVIVVIVKKKR